MLSTFPDKYTTLTENIANSLKEKKKKQAQPAVVFSTVLCSIC